MILSRRSFGGTASRIEVSPEAKTTCSGFCACEYGLPQLFSVIELFAKRLDPETNYSLFVAEMPRWFRAEVLKNLDEQGVPVQISERLLRTDDTIETLRARLIEEASKENSDHLTFFEQRWVINALAL